ncbi:MAG: sigma 54-interacting transcriptional regulator [Acidobacteriota bacterium]
MHHRSESTVHSTSFARGLTAATSDRSPLPALTVLAHPDARRVGDRALLGEALNGVQVLLDRRRPEFHAPDRSSGRPLDDRHLSRRSIVLSRSDEGWSLDVGGTSTRVRIDGRPVDGVHRFADPELDDGVVVELAERIVLLLHRHTPTTDGISGDDLGLVGESDGITFLRDEIRRVADLDVGVLLRGETGSGKELVARALHVAGRRSAGPFVAVNLGALAPSLAASELFGVARGAFTGADRSRDGCFVRAHGGTLFLDEIGEAPSEIQVALLRTLETGEILAVGASTPRRVDVRTLAATDADLDHLIASDGFREPLLHRLAGYEIWLPPLRRRRDDLGRLLVHFLRQFSDELGDHRLGRDDGEPWIDPELVTRMAHFGWPGNVRQLRNVVRQLAIGNRGRHCLRSTPAVDRLLTEPTASAASP